MPSKRSPHPSPRGRRRSTRLDRSENENNDNAGMKTEEETTELQEKSAESDSESENEGFLFEGTVYETYEEMVKAKRKRNQEFLKKKGLLHPLGNLIPAPSRKKEGNQNGIKRRKKSPSDRPVVKRKSNRLAGTPADGHFVEHEGGGGFIISDQASSSVQTNTKSGAEEEQNRDRRINDGSPLSIKEAIEHCETKWVQETSVEEAKSFCENTLKPLVATKEGRKNKLTMRSPTSVAASDKSGYNIRNKVEQLSVDDGNFVAKVTPDRIYSVAAHPSTQTLVVAAGDKQGYVGMWNVNQKAQDGANDGVHLFRFHSRPVNTLEWTPEGLLSSSYDGTVRYFDIAKEAFEEIFSTDEEEDDFYTQYLIRDHRSNDHTFFLSTSMGSVLHVDRRIGEGPGNVTFHADLSEKKINSVSLHRDGYCLATAGLDRTIKFWDLRKFGSGARGKGAGTARAPAKDALLGQTNNSLSVNSAFFSPSGEYLVATNMSNTLDIYHNAHLQAMEEGPKKKGGGPMIRPRDVIRHNNQTGRWLTTFMAQWHPELDVFCVGSMQKPRAIDVFDGASGDHLRAIQGDALTAVASRCCFHPSAEQIVLIGGNSSGRITVIR